MNLKERLFGETKATDYDLNGNRFYQEYIIQREFGGVSHFKVAAALRAGISISEGVAAMPVGHGKETVDASGRLIKTPDPMSQVSLLFRKRPNEFMTPIELVESITLRAVFDGVGRAYIDRGYRGKIKAIVPAPHISPKRDHTTGKVTYSGNVTGYGYLKDITRRDIIEVTNPRWDELEGLDTTGYMKEVFKLALSLQDRQLDDAGKKQLRGFFTFPDQVGEETAKAVQAAVADKIQGAPILDSGADFKSIGASAADIQLMETRRFAIEEIARAYGIHPLLLGHDGAGQSLTRVADVMDYHVTVTLGPWVRRWEAALTFSLAADDEFIDMDEFKYFRMNIADRASYAAQALGAGGNTPWETPNSILAMFGKNPIEGGDALPTLRGANDAT